MQKLETTGTKFTDLPIFIMAGDSRQADYCAKHVLKLKSKNEYRYVDYDHRMMGQRGKTLCLFGTWINKPNANMILEMARIRQFNIIEIEDNR
jgi:hypothetical protein